MERRDGKSLKSLYIVDRRVLAPYFMKIFPILPSPFFSSFVHPPPHTYLSPPTLIPRWINWYSDSISHTYKHTNTQSTVMGQQTDTLI